MGDRVNIAVKENGKRVYFYGHWSGQGAPEIVRKALARKQRWNDPPYLARIIFCAMVDGQEKSETGYGISTEPGDNSYPFIIVDCDKQEVRIEADGREHFTRCAPRGEPLAYSFDSYSALPEATWATLDRGIADEAA